MGDESLSKSIVLWMNNGPVQRLLAGVDAYESNRLSSLHLGQGFLEEFAQRISGCEGTALPFFGEPFCGHVIKTWYAAKNFFFCVIHVYTGFGDGSRDGFL